MNDKAASGKPRIDIKATHVTKQWKYESPLMACRFDPTGQFVFAAAQDNTIQRWNLNDDQHTSLVGHDSWLRSIGFSPDGTILYTGGYDGQLLFWETKAADPKPIKTIDAHAGWIRWLSLSPDGSIVATGGNDNLVKLWSTETGELIRILEGHKSHIYSTMFHPEGAVLLSGDLLGVIHQWEVATGKLTRSLDAKELHTYNGGQRAHYGGVRSMSLSPDGKQLACGGLHKASNPFGAVQEPLVVVFQWESGEQLRLLEANGIPKGITWRVIYHPSGHLIGASGGGSGGFVLFWQGEETKETHKFKLPNTVLDLDLHPNNIDLVTAHHDRHVRISRMQAKSA